MKYLKLTRVIRTVHTRRTVESRHHRAIHQSESNKGRNWTDLDILGVVLGQVLLDHLLGDVTLLSPPEVRGLVKRVDDLEPVRVLLGELVPSFSQHCA
jgi:hypothetical protein